MEIFISVIFVVILLLAIYKSIFVTNEHKKSTDDDLELQNQIMNQQHLQHQINQQINLNQTMIEQQDSPDFNSDIN